MRPEQLTVGELKSKLASLGLPGKGKKAELVALLLEALAKTVKKEEKIVEPVPKAEAGAAAAEGNDIGYVSTCPQTHPCVPSHVTAFTLSCSQTLACQGIQDSNLQRSAKILSYSQ